jgi:hypothetical protein
MVEPEWAQARWRKSSHSGNAGGCVECATEADVIGVRDSKDPDGAVLVFAADRWREFIDGVKHGEFDRR